MTLKYVLPAMALLVSAGAAAEQYTTFASLQADHARANGDSETNWEINGRYFFNAIDTVGPLDQFRYILAETNVHAAFSREYDMDAWHVGGEYYAENGLLVSATHQRFDDFDMSSIGIGYLINRDFLVKVTAFKPEEGDTTFMFNAQYNVQLQGNDYIGFAAMADDEFDYYSVSTKYFRSLGEDRYLVAEAEVGDDGDDTFWSVGGSYYFSKLTSVGVSYTDDDAYELNAKHFVSKNWAIEAGFSSNTDDSALKVYSLAVIGQF